MQALRSFAVKLPETDEGVACEGTALESRTVRRKGKAFLFLRATEARFKIGPSIADAKARAAKDPQHLQVGAGGWALVKFDGATLPLDVLRGWVAESHELAGGGKPASPKKKAAKKG